MRKGIAAVESAMEDAAKGGGGFSGRLGYFGLKADESIVVRFLTDMSTDVLTLDFYEFIQDVNNKGQNFAVAADVYDDPDVTDWVKELGGLQKDYGSKDLVEPYPKTRSVGLAVVREEVAIENDKGRPTMAYEDLWTTIESKKGEKFDARKFIVVKMAYKNFWGPLKTLFDEYGTICDRDYKIKRVGGGTDTNYSFIAKTPDPDWNYDNDSAESVAALQARYGYGTGKNAEGEEISEEERFAYCPMTIDEWAEDSCSEDRVRYFLDEEYRAKQEKGSSDSKASDSKTSGSKRESLVSDDDEAQSSAAPPPSGSVSVRERMARHKAK